MKKTYSGPRGVKLVLDSSENFPDDPGNGTPAMVYFKDGSATLTCVEGSGSVWSDDKGDIDVPQIVQDWLASDPIANEVERMYKAGRNGNW